MEGKFTINKKEYGFQFRPESTLLEVLRENGFTEVKNGCGAGECGSCVILLNGKVVNSCQVLAGSAVEKEITTVKGIGDIHFPHVIQESFALAGAIQCGFCTPAKVLCAYSLLSDNPDPTDEEIKRAFDGTICRCTGYVKIIEAVRIAYKRMKKNE